MSSMASAVDRVPLDHRLIEFAATIPLKYKIKMIKNLVLTSDKVQKFMIFQNIF